MPHKSKVSTIKSVTSVHIHYNTAMYDYERGMALFRARSVYVRKEDVTETRDVINVTVCCQRSDKRSVCVAVKMRRRGREGIGGTEKGTYRGWIRKGTSRFLVTAAVVCLIIGARAGPLRETGSLSLRRIADRMIFLPVRIDLNNRFRCIYRAERSVFFHRRVLRLSGFRERIAPVPAPGVMRKQIT